MKSHYNDFYLGLGTASIFLFVALWLIPDFITVPASVQMTGVSPSFWPEVVSWSLVGLGLLLAFSSYAQVRKAKERTLKAGAEPDRSAAIPRITLRSVWMTFLAIGAMVAYYYLVSWLGMLVSSTVILFGYTLIYGDHDLKVTIPVAVLVPVILYFFFVKVANIPLPSGPWGW